MADPRTPTLYLFSGLPGVGKSTLARKLAAHTRSAYLRIDTLEQALRDLCGLAVVAEGYELAHRIARDQLLAGLSVVADCCNPIALTRDAWMAVATDAGSPCQNLEIVCSDLEEHQRRVEGRPVEVEGLCLPTWQDVLAREYEPWSTPRITLDTAMGPVEPCFQELLRRLGLEPGGQA